jgi:hypothetical protein
MEEDDDAEDFNKELKLLGQNFDKYEQNRFGISAH